jgi:hypothetical protein
LPPLFSAKTISNAPEKIAASGKRTLSKSSLPISAMSGYVLARVSGGRSDRASVTAELKKAGKVVQTVNRKVSQDGKMLTMTFKGTNGKGQAVNSVEIYDRQ